MHYKFASLLRITPNRIRTKMSRITFYESMVDYIELCKVRFIEQGVDRDVVESIMGGPPDSMELQSMPTKKYLKNLSEESADTTKNYASSNSIKADASSVTVMYNKKWIGQSEVVVVLDYADNAHALFGDFVKTYPSFKTDYLKSNPYFQYKPNLTFGAGWMMRDKTKLPELRKALKNAKISFREVERDEYVAELQGKSKKSDTKVEEVSESDEDVPSKPTPKSGGKATVKEIPQKDLQDVKPKKDSKELISKDKNVKKVPEKVSEKPVGKNENATAKPKLKITKNKYGNFEQEETGLVFVKLPVGPKAKEINVVVGYQDPSPAKNEKGLDTVLPLTEEHTEVAEKNSYTVLTDEIVDKVKKHDAALGDLLDNILLKAIDVDEFGSLDELDDDEGGENDENFDDDDEDEA